MLYTTLNKLSNKKDISKSSTTKWFKQSDQREKLYVVHVYFIDKFYYNYNAM